MGKTLAKTTGDVAGTGVKVLLDSSSTVSKVAWDTLTTADKIVQDTANVILQVRDDTLTTSVHAAGLAVSPAAADAVLEFATKVFTAASASAIVDTILGVIHRSLEALTQSLSGAALILRDIYTNDANKVTTSYILNNLPALFLFLYDLIKPENVIPGFAPAVNGVVGGGVLGGSNPYNELDLEQEVNRNALVYQAQRLALSLVEILRLGRDYMPQRKLEDIKINVKLRSDFGGGDKPPEPTYTSKLGGDLVSRANEKWLFVNGIANELVWFEASCNKVRDRFGREVKGVFNRSDGFLWDLVECAGERSAAESNKLIERTESSRAAQTVLGKELESALWPEKGTPPEKVVMIAHSQGCLLLRLVLQDMVQRYGEGSPKRNDMKERLRVFTFANPSIDWRVIDDGTKQPLSSYAKITEHFAHELDFVARLGVATHQRTGYGDDVVFYSTNGRGHLFGAHYPLEAGAYEQGAESKLLRAVDGNEIS
ncbi:hypothetical protein GE09DRAFT_950088 [Coniochaeta sp. 2T2.1]|nr:hypothetical protein GE09DRAFT_950088 [Coniochaeta sp. 2T2.1]